MHNCILYKNEVTSFSPQNVPYSSSHYLNFRLYPHPLILAVHYLYFYPLFFPDYHFPLISCPLSLPLYFPLPSIFRQSLHFSQICVFRRGKSGDLRGSGIQQKIFVRQGHNSSPPNSTRQPKVCPQLCASFP